MRLVQAFEAVFLFGFRFARPTRERRGRYAGFFPGYPASARLTVTQTSCRITIFTRQTRNTYTTPIPLEAHRGSHIITSGLACNTVKHETAVVASFIVFVTHRRIVPRDARPSARDPRRRRRSGCSAYNRDALRLRPATSRAIRIFTRFSPDSTCCMLWGSRADTRAPDSASFAPASAWTGGVTGTGRRGRRPRSLGHIPRYDRDVHSSPLAPPLALHEPTFIRSDVHGTR
jgi:hypothetical protein